MNKIFCISGPASTGKTTLFNALQTYQLPYNIYYSPELIREYLSSDHLNQISNSPIKMFNLQIELSKQLIRQYDNILKENYDLVIMDRAPTDIIVYTLINYSLLPSVTTIDQVRLYNIINSLKQLMNKVDHIYLTTVEQNYIPEDDGFRPSIYTEQRQVEINLFNEIQLGNITKLPSDMQERCNIIINDIHKALQ